MTRLKDFIKNYWYVILIFTVSLAFMLHSHVEKELPFAVNLITVILSISLLVIMILLKGKILGGRFNWLLGIIVSAVFILLNTLLLLAVSRLNVSPTYFIIWLITIELGHRVFAIGFTRKLFVVTSCAVIITIAMGLFGFKPYVSVQITSLVQCVALSFLPKFILTAKRLPRISK